MALIKLGSTPKSFKRALTVDMLDGTKGSIEVTYEHNSLVFLLSHLESCA